MQKVLFSHSYFLRFDPKQWALMQPYPPLGTIYAAAVLRKSGHEVSLFDPMFSGSSAEIAPVLERVKPDLVVFCDDGFNYLTKMCLTNMREAAFEMIGHAKRRGCIVIVNSSDATDHPEKYLQRGADYIIAGEAEQTLCELVENIEDVAKLKDTPGLIFHHHGELTRTPKRSVLTDLDSLPLPAWDLIDMEAYRKRWLKSSGYFSLNISTTRGCPFKCNWCAKPIYGNRYNVHSPERIIAELKILNRNFQVSHFWVTDDIFGLKPGWISEFADLMVIENLKISFKIQTRVDLLLQKDGREDNITALAKAGCETVWVGAESGSQKILDAMDKGTTVGQIFEATRLLKKHRIKVAFFLQFGYPGETAEDIQKTTDMVMKLMPDDIGVSVSYPLPGTVFYDRVKAELTSKANWTDSDDLSLLFSNSYPSEFYKELQRYLHKRFRSRQGLIALKRLLKSPSKFRAVHLRRLGKAPIHFAGSMVHARRMKSMMSKHESK